MVCCSSILNGCIVLDNPWFHWLRVTAFSESNLLLLHPSPGHRVKDTSSDYLLFVQQWPPGTCAVSSIAFLMHPTNHLHVAGVTVYTHVVNGFMHPVLG